MREESGTHPSQTYTELWDLPEYEWFPQVSCHLQGFHSLPSIHLQHELVLLHTNTNVYFLKMSLFFLDLIWILCWGVVLRHTQNIIFIILTNTELLPGKFQSQIISLCFRQGWTTGRSKWEIKPKFKHVHANNYQIIANWKYILAMSGLCVKAISEYTPAVLHWIFYTEYDPDTVYKSMS